MKECKYEDELNRGINRILDCFGGADGGVSFIQFKFRMGDIAKLADGGNDKAAEVVEIVSKFSNLIDNLQPRRKENNND